MPKAQLVSTIFQIAKDIEEFSKHGGEYRNRTGVHGFAIRCVTTPPTRLRTKLSGFCFEPHPYFNA